MEQDSPSHTGDDDESSLPPFLTKLYELVDLSSAEHIEWGKEGRTFRITNATLFARDVLPLYFKHNSLASFTRQLLTYGFKRCHSLPGSTSALEFGHEHFTQGDRGSLRLIRRRVAPKKTRGLVPQGPYELPAPPGAPPDNAMLYQMERLREYVTNVERQFMVSMAEIKRQLGDMERFAYSLSHTRAAMTNPINSMPLPAAMVQVVNVQAPPMHIDPAALQAAHSAAAHAQHAAAAQQAAAQQQAQQAQHAHQFAHQQAQQHAQQHAQHAQQHAAHAAHAVHAAHAAQAVQAAQTTQTAAVQEVAQQQPDQSQHGCSAAHDVQHQQVASGLVRLSRGDERGDTQQQQQQPSEEYTQQMQPRAAAPQPLPAVAQRVQEQAQPRQVHAPQHDGFVMATVVPTAGAASHMPQHLHPKHEMQRVLVAPGAPQYAIQS